MTDIHLTINHSSAWKGGVRFLALSLESRIFKSDIVSNVPCSRDGIKSAQAKDER